MEHADYMKIALGEARKAAADEEVPVGAVLVSAEGEILARTRNQTISRKDPTAHAEILALRQAAEKMQNYRLPGTRLYTTIEPCIMCMGAIIHARVATLVFGAPDPKWGAAGSLYDFSADRRLNHQVEVIPGVCEEACRELMVAFFQSRRKSVASQDGMS